MIGSLVLLWVLYVMVGCVCVVVADAAADIAGVPARPYVRVPLAIVVVLAWLPLLVIAAVLLALCLVALGITRR